MSFYIFISFLKFVNHFFENIKLVFVFADIKSVLILRLGKFRQIWSEK